MAIDHDAGERCEQQRRNLAREADDTEEELRTGEPVDQPADRDTGNPRADQGDALSVEEESIVTVRERSRDAESHTASYRPFSDSSVLTPN